jgi:hypothetical protein
VAGALRGWWRRVRATRPSSAAEGGGNRPDAYDAHRPGRTHLVLRDGSVVEADLDPETNARLEYLARRAVAPPPPEV